MKYALFLGCTIPARARNYEVSARGVASRLGIEFVDIKDFVCCGFPMRGIDRRSAWLMGAYNLALVEEKGLDICTLCSSCTSALTEVVHSMGSSHAEEHADMLTSLQKMGFQYSGRVKVRHIARILFEEIGKEKIKKTLEKDLSGLKVAVHYGCHYFKPSEVYDGFDDPEVPYTIEELVRHTGAEVVDYPGKKRCCGGPVLPVEEKVALTLAKQKLDDIKEAGADLICLVCPFCALMYDGNQKGIEAEFQETYNLPVLYLTQLLGIAMGIDRKSLGLNLNVVKTKKLLERFY